MTTCFSHTPQCQKICYVLFLFLSCEKSNKQLCIMILLNSWTCCIRMKIFVWDSSPKKWLCQLLCQAPKKPKNSWEKDYLKKKLFLLLLKSVLLYNINESVSSSVSSPFVCIFLFSVVSIYLYTHSGGLGHPGWDGAAWSGPHRKFNESASKQWSRVPLWRGVQY